MTYDLDLPQSWLHWMIVYGGLPVIQAEQIVDSDTPHLYRYFEASLQACSTLLSKYTNGENDEDIFREGCKISANFILGEMARLANKTHTKIYESKCTPSHLNVIVALFQKKLITAATAKYLIGKIWDSGENPMDLYANEQLACISQDEDIQALIDSLKNTHGPKFEEYVRGNTKIESMLIGHLIKTTKGCVDVEVLSRKLKECMVVN